MSKASDKRKAYLNTVRPDRREWRLEMPQRCMWCGRQDGDDGWLEVHEIMRKSHAPWKWGDRCNYLLIDNRCHAREFANMPHGQQLAVKKARDPDNYDLVLWNELFDPASDRGPNEENYVTAADVAVWEME